MHTIELKWWTRHGGRRSTFDSLVAPPSCFVRVVSVSGLPRTNGLSATSISYVDVATTRAASAHARHWMRRNEHLNVLHGRSRQIY